MSLPVICLGGAWLGGPLLRRWRVDWAAWRTCPVCKAKPGEACMALSGRVAGGRPNGMPQVLAQPHGHRRKRVPRRTS